MFSSPINMIVIGLLHQASGTKNEISPPILPLIQLEALLPFPQLLAEQKHETAPRRRLAKSAKIGGEVITHEDILHFSLLIYDYQAAR